MDASDQLEEIIREITTRHGLAVSRDDPILVLHTINKRLMLDSAKAQQVMLDRYKEELEVLAARWKNDATETAERVLSASLSASKEAMGSLLDDAAKFSADRIRLAFEEGTGRAAAATFDSRRVSILNVLASCLTLAAAFLALIASLH